MFSNVQIDMRYTDPTGSPFVRRERDLVGRVFAWKRSCQGKSCWIFSTSHYHSTTSPSAPDITSLQNTGTHAYAPSTCAICRLWHSLQRRHDVFQPLQSPVLAWSDWWGETWRVSASNYCLSRVYTNKFADLLSIAIAKGGYSNAKRSVWAEECRTSGSVP